VCVVLPDTPCAPITTGPHHLYAHCTHTYTPLLYSIHSRTHTRTHACTPAPAPHTHTHTPLPFHNHALTQPQPRTGSLLFDLILDMLTVGGMVCAWQCFPHLLIYRLYDVGSIFVSGLLLGWRLMSVWNVCLYLSHGAPLVCALITMENICLPTHYTLCAY
jgi:hypothetical protein